MSWEDFPKEIKQLAQWCVAGPDKAPYVANGSSLRRVSVHEVNALHTFEDAYAIAQYFGATGIGFILTANDPFCCIDLDVKDSTSKDKSGKPYPPNLWTPPEALDLYYRIVQEFQTYGELSHSGKGMHLWLYGKIGKGIHRQGVELYSQERFIICTGNSFTELGFNFDSTQHIIQPVVRNPSPVPINPNKLQQLTNMVEQMRPAGGVTIELVEVEEELDDQEIIERAMAADNADKFNALCAGNWQEMKYPSQSEADLALMQILALYSVSNMQCRKIFRCTQLGKREKATKNDKYLNRTLKIARGRLEEEKNLVQQGKELVEGFLAHQNSVDVLSLISGSVDVTKPPGLAGDICEYMHLKAKRALPEVYPLAALQLMALAGRQWKTLGDVKPNLLTLSIAPSASGKDIPQEVVKSLAKRIGCYDLILGNAGSFKDLIYNLFDNDGASLYVIDEVHSFLNSMKSKNSQSYESKMEAEILTMFTTKLYAFRGIEKREIKRELETKKELLKKIVETKPDNSNEDEINRSLKHLENSLSLLGNGIENPFFSMMGFSVPSQLDQFVNLNNLESGFLGRTLLVKCPDNRNKLQRVDVDEVKLATLEISIVQRLQYIQNNAGSIILDDEACERYKSILDWLDEDEQLNHPELGSIYARAPEMLNKVLSILSLEDGRVTLPTLEYGLVLIRQSIDDVKYLLIKCLTNTGNTTDEAVEAFAKAMVHKKTKGIGCTYSVLKTYVTKPKAWIKMQERHFEKDCFQELINMMLENGEIRFEKQGKRERYISLKKH